jgi:hypothetical protein
MKYLKIFEDFNNDEFPDVFNGTLIRGVKIDKDEYIDDPKLRKVSSGSSGDEDYIEFINNYSNLGIPHPLKSIHMYFRPDTDISTDYYGTAYDISPQKDAIFGFNKELRNGGLGSTWWFAERTAKDFLGKTIEEFPDYYEDKDEFMEAITEYQKMLIDGGVIGTLTYDELLKMSKEEGETLQVWTESPCYHKKHIKSKEPKPYKRESILTDNDFIELGIDNNGRSEFYKQHGKEINRIDINIPIARRRMSALNLLKKWSENELH